MADEIRNIRAQIQVLLDQGANEQTVNGIEKVADSFDLMRQRIEDFRSVQRETAAQIESTDNVILSAMSNILEAEEEQRRAREANIAVVEKEAAAQAKLSQAYQEQADIIHQQSIGYGQAGGQIGPAEAGAEEDGGGGIGNPLAIGRGARAAGGLARIAGAGEIANAGTALADVIFVFKGFSEVVTGLGASVPLAATGIGLVGAAFIVLTIELNNVKKAIEDGAAAVKKADSELTEFFKDSATLTSDEIKNKRAAAQADTDALQQTIDINRGKIAQLAQDAIKQFQSGDTIGEAASAVGIKTLSDQTDELVKKLGTASQQVNNYNNELGSDAVKLNDAAVAARDFASSQVQLAQRFEADDKLNNEQIKERITALNNENAAKENALATLRENQATLDKNSEQYLKNDAAIKAYNDDIFHNFDEITHLTDVSAGLATTRKSEADAIAAQNAAIQQHLQFIEQENKLLAPGSTTDQVDSARTALEGKIKRDQAEIANLESQNQLTAEQITLLDKLKAQVDEEKKDLSEINKVVAPAVKAADAFGNINKALTDFADKQKALETDLATSQANTRARELAAENEYTQGSLQDFEARVKIALDESRREIEIKQQASDKIIDIETATANKEADALLSLNRQLADDQNKSNDRIAKLNRDAGYQAEDDQRAHEQRLADIKKSANADERIALQDRQFGQFYQLQLKNTDQRDTENAAYAQKEDDLKIHLARQVQDQQISLDTERKQRLVDYNRKIEDLNTAEIREEQQTLTAEDRKLAELREKEQEALDDLRRSEMYKIELLRYNLGVELQMQVDQENAKIKLAAQTTDAIILYNTQALAQAFGSGGSSSTPPPAGDTSEVFDNGGSFNAGKPFLKGNITERFDIGGKSYVLPGAALIYPLQGGSATPQGNAGSQSLTFAPQIIVSGANYADGDALSEMIYGRVLDAWDEIKGN